MCTYNIVYIDDRPDATITRTLRKKYKCYQEITFSCADGYESLIKNDVIKEANIIIIDSRLFENATIADAKFTGEEFKIVLKRLYPFIEVMIISKNEDSLDPCIIRKYERKEQRGKTQEEYYNDILIKRVEEKIKSIDVVRKIAEKLSSNDSINKLHIEKVIDSIEGIEKYNELSSDDITNLILEFKEVKEMLEND